MRVGKKMDNKELVSILLEKHDKLAEDINDIKLNLAVHIKRTDLAEEAIKINKEQLELNIIKLEHDLKPLKSHVNLMNSIFRAVGIIATVIGVIAGVVEIMTFILTFLK